MADFVASFQFVASMATLLKVGLALALVVTVATAEDKCRTGCHGVTPNVFKFATGSTYKYEYDGKVDLSLSSAEGQHSTTKVKATVLLTQQAQCNQVLRVQNLQIISPDKKYTNIADIEKPIVLNFHDGHIEDIICTEPSDTQNSLNIKRAVASMFQAALHYHGTEIDVFGSCPTQFSQRKEGPQQIITKTRNLNKCAHRESLKQGFISTAFDLNSEIKTSPILQGKYEAVLKLKGGIPQIITVDEDYLYVPFSNGDKGAKARGESQLKFLGVTKENPKVSCNIPRSIIFDDPHPITSDKSSVGTILKSVKDAANAIDLNVKENSASKFSSIIKLMRGAPKKDLTAIYGQIRAGAGFNNKETGKRVFLDALFRARTGDAIEVAIDIYKSNGLDDIESKIFFASLNFVQHATEGSLNAAANLLSTPNLPRAAYLGIGVLASRYCRQHSCEDVKGVNALLTALQSKLNAKPANRDAENVVLSALKSIRNAGYVNNPLVGKIIELAQDKQAPSRIRVAALEAYLASACNDRFRDSAINLLKDTQIDSEIRIKAYLALAECPNGKAATAVKTVLDNEPSVQVGGYIVTHIATLLSSANPDKALAKAQLGNIKTTKKFPIDFRQYSFNGEYSYDFDSLGVGESVEGNVIYSQKSYLPRSLSLNLTVELFGHRYNFLELETRQENLDSLFSSYFGPKGEVLREDYKDVIKSSADKFRGISNKIGEKIKSYKHKREINKNQIENFAKQLTDKQNPLNKDLDLDLSLKLFGSELLFLSLNDDIKQYGSGDILDYVINSIDTANEKLKNFDRTLSSNFLFLDSQVSYPTSTGFPLRLSIEGVASVQLKTSGEFPDSQNFKFSFIPSISTEISSRFVIDAAVVESGLNVVGNLYSSIGAAVESSWNNNDFDFKFTLPLDKQEVLTVTHNVVFETRELCGPETKVPLKFIQSKDFSVCLDQLKSYIGLTVCADVNQPNIGEASSNVLPFPFNGNSKLSVVIQKNDFGHIRIHNEELANGLKGVVELIDPNQKPKSAFKYSLNFSPEIVLELISPEVSGKFETRIVHSDTELYGLVRLTSNQIEYYVKLGLASSGTSARTIYKPIMEYKPGQGDPQKLPYHLTGQIIVEESEDSEVKYTADHLKLISPNNPPIDVSGYFARQALAFSGELTLNDGTRSGTLKGKLHLEDDGFNVNVHFVNDFNKNANLDLKYSLKGKDLLNIASNLQLIHGPDLADKNAVFKLINDIKYITEGSDPYFDTGHELSYPGVGLNNKFVFATRKNYFLVEVDVKYQQIRLGTELEIELDKKSKGDFEVEYELYGFDNKLEIELDRVVNGQRSNIRYKLILNGDSIEVEGDVKHILEQHRADIAHDLVIKITSRPDIKWKSELKYTQKDLDTSLKVHSGKDVIFDGFLKATKAGDANGNIKLNIPTHITAIGNVKTDKGTGSSNLLVNLLDVQRKIKSELKFTVKEPTYNIDATLYTNYEKDNSRKYRLITANQIKPDSLFDSKNTLEILGQKSVFNIKLSQKGEINNRDDAIEAELILPSEQYFAGKIHRTAKIDKSILNGQSYISLEQRPNKNAAGKTLTLKAVGKDINPNEGVFDLAYTLNLDNGAGQTLNGEVNLKKSKTNEENHIDYNGKLYGSALSEVLQASLVSNCKGDDNVADYKVSASYGKGANLNIKGKHDIHPWESGQATSGDLTVDILTPNSLIRVVKLNLGGSVKLVKKKEDMLDYSLVTALFVDDDGKEQGATVDVKYTSAGVYGYKEGYSEDKIIIQNQDPIILLLKYELYPNKDLADVTLKYTKDKEIRVFYDIERVNNDTLTYDLQLETPSEKAKKVKLAGKLLQNGDESFSTEATLTIDNLKYIAKAGLNLNDDRPSYDVELTYPTGKIDKLYVKVLRRDSYGLSTESKVILHIYDFSLDTKFDISIKSAEDFFVKVYADSAKLNLNKLSLNANTEDVHGSKKLKVNAKQDGKTIVDGTTTYRIRKEEGKIIIDGSGALTVNGDKKSGNFKILYRELNSQRDKETGIQLTINSVIGAKAVDIEYIFTEDHFKYLTSYCVEKKDCAHVEIERKEQGSLEVVEVNLDLRPLGVSHEFGLKSETDVEKFKHLLDVHLVSNQFKYQYNALILPSQSHFTLTTPKRVVSLESEINTPKGKEPFKGQIVLYLNKKLKPQDKTLLAYEVLYNKDIIKVDTKLSAPPLKKPLSIYYKYHEKPGDNYDSELILDVLPNSPKKIIISAANGISQNDNVITTNAKSLVDFQPLNYKYEESQVTLTNYKDYVFEVDYSAVSSYKNNPIKSAYNYKINKDGGSAQLIIHNKVIYDIKAKAKISKEYSVIDTDYKVIGSEPTSSHVELKNGNTLKFALYKTAKPNDKLQVNSGFIPGSIADFRIDLHANNKKVDLIHGSVKLDESDFGKSDYGIDSNNIREYLVSPAKLISQNVVKASTDHLTEAFEQAKSEFKNVADSAQENKPDFTPLLTYYSAEGKALREELITDQSLKQLSEALDNIVSAVITVTVDFLRALNETVEKLIAALHKQTLNLADMFEKDILPKVKEIVNGVGDKIFSLLESITDLCFGLLGQITSFFDAHQNELKQIVTALSQVSQDIITFVQKVNEDLIKMIQTETGRIVNELQSLPVVDDVTNYVKTLLSNKPLTEEQIAEFKSHMQELRDKIPLKKVGHFIDLTSAYIEKKLRDTPCDDGKEIGDITAALLDALEEVFNAFVIEYDANQFKLPVASKLFDTLPDSFVGSLSAIGRIINGEIPTYQQLYSFATLNPEQFFLPLRKYAVVAQGQHIFTFDGKHLTFPGKCSYLLARDVVNNEFSIVGLYVNGAITELTFFDNSDTITLKKNGAVTLNGAATEFPVRGQLTDAFRTYNEVHLKSQKGVNIYCQPDLTLCVFSISGYYHGHLRGLLGNANAEPYDDYTTAKGAIVTSESDFGNSYKIQPNCPAVKTVDHHTHHHAESCTKLFTELSELSICYPFVNPTNFRQACDHGVAAGIANTEAAIAKAYTAACLTRYVPTFLPSQYVKCENSDKPFDLYDIFSVKVPQKAADIVFAIDASKENEEVYKDLILALGSSLVKDLSERGIKDVEYHLLTYGGIHSEWPSHITTNGGKMTFKGRMPQLKFTEPVVDDDLDFGCETLNFIASLIQNYVKELALALGFEPQSLAYLEATNYPFRAHAAKAIVAVSSEPCQKNSIGILQLVQKLRASLLTQSTINLNLITPLGKDCSFKVKDEKTSKNVIGFNDEGVFTFTDAKKKPTGNPDLLKDLSYDDFCSEHTAKSGGNVFVLDNFSKNKKLFTSVTSFNIAESLVSSEQGLDCACLRDGLFSAKNVCVVSNTKDKPPTTRKLLKG